MPRTIATTNRVDRDHLVEFLSTRHRAILSTTRANGRPQFSPVS
jgi:hypothetical protein